MKKKNIFLRAIWAVIFAVAIFAPLNCGCEYVKAGYVGVKVYTLGGQKGDFQVLGVGRHWEGMYEDIYIFPTYTQSRVWTANIRDDSPIDEHFTLQSKEGVSIDADVGITYSIEPARVVDLFKKYRKDVDTITNTYLRQYIRDGLNKYSTQYTTADLYGDGKTKVIAAAEKEIREIMKENGIVLEKLYWVNSLRPPDNITEEINNKVAAIQIAQRKDNEVKAAEAQAQINRLNNGSLSNMNMRMKELENQSKAIDKWNGQLPGVMPPGTTLPFLNIDK